MFILAVMLERKRVFKVKEQIVRDGKRVFIYEQPGTGDVFTIADPDLHWINSKQVQRDVAALLEHGLNPPAPAEKIPHPAWNRLPPLKQPKAQRRLEFMICDLRFAGSGASVASPIVNHKS